MYRVWVLPDSHAQHVLQIYAGLYELANQVPIQFRYFKERTAEMRAWNPSSLWAEIEDLDRRQRVKVCFDMHDSGKISSWDGLQECDVYFKRSYSRNVVNRLEPGLQSKVKPLGLNYVVIGERDKDLLIRLFLERRLKKAQNITTTEADRKFHRLLLLSSYAKGIVPGPLKQKLLRTAREFEESPQVSLSGKIFFQCRVWPPEMAPRASNLKELNDRRAELIRSLRARFGERFVGGLVPNAYAQEHYPDCITGERTDHASYLELVKGAQIAVATAGIHRSIPWKCAEYLAASKCVVSEPFAYELPEALREGVHYLQFTNSRECIEACETLLENPEKARAMQATNSLYYHSHIKPAKMMESCFKVALKAA